MLIRSQLDRPRLLISLCVLATLACSDSEPRSQPEASATGLEPTAVSEPRIHEAGRFRKFRTQRFDEDLSDEQREMIEQLEAIGYATGSQDAGAAMGVTRHDAERAFQGLNFYVSGHAAEARLIDMDGRELHLWSHDFWSTWPDYPIAQSHAMTAYWRRAHLYENGDILAVHEGLGLVKLDRDSNLLWAQPNRAHHDLHVTPEGDIWVLTREAHVVPWVHPETPTLEDFAVRLDADGKEQQRISLIDAFAGTGFERVIAEIEDSGGDVFHTNTLLVLDGRAEHPAFAQGNLLTYMLTVGVIAVVDPATGKVVWARKGFPQNRHDPKILESGNLLIFENMRKKGESSRVLEFESVSKELVWEYAGSEAEPFYSATCGTAERLPGGTTLVTESDGGRAFEVTPSGEIVWEFVSPHRAGPKDEFVATLFDVVRLPSDFPVDWVREPSGP